MEYLNINKYCLEILKRKQNLASFHGTPSIRPPYLIHERIIVYRPNNDA